MQDEKEDTEREREREEGRGREGVKSGRFSLDCHVAPASDKGVTA